MAISVTHAFNCGIADDPTAASLGQVLPSHWNAAHTVTGTREVLTANRTYYVATAGGGGNDGNNGLSAGAPFLTIQHACDVCATIDFNGNNVTIQLADGTYSSGTVQIPITVGQASVNSFTINGNATTPANVVVTTSVSGAMWSIPKNTAVTLQNMTVSNTYSGFARLFFCSGGHLLLGAGMVIGACNNEQIYTEAGGYIEAYSAMTVTGNGTFFMSAGGVSEISVGAIAIAFGTRTYTATFQSVSASLLLINSGATFTGTITGSRYQAYLNGIVNTNTGNVNFLPGSTAGTASAGGQYN